MPAVMIRQLDALGKIMEQTTHPDQIQVLLDQAAMIHRACQTSVPEAGDQADVDRRYQELLAIDAQPTRGAAAGPAVRG
jgi:hypothetical protein